MPKITQLSEIEPGLKFSGGSDPNPMFLIRKLFYLSLL